MQNQPISGDLAIIFKPYVSGRKASNSFYREISWRVAELDIVIHTCIPYSVTYYSVTYCWTTWTVPNAKRLCLKLHERSIQCFICINVVLVSTRQSTRKLLWHTRADRGRASQDYQLHSINHTILQVIDTEGLTILVLPGLAWQPVGDWGEGTWRLVINYGVMSLLGKPWNWYHASVGLTINDMCQNHRTDDHFFSFYFPSVTTPSGEDWGKPLPQQELAILLMLTLPWKFGARKTAPMSVGAWFGSGLAFVLRGVNFFPYIVFTTRNGPRVPFAQLVKLNVTLTKSNSSSLGKMVLGGGLSYFSHACYLNPIWACSPGNWILNTEPTGHGWLKVLVVKVERLWGQYNVYLVPEAERYNHLSSYMQF